MSTTHGPPLPTASIGQTQPAADLAARPRIVMIVLNTFTHDSRVTKEATSLDRAGFDVGVFALHANGLALYECLAHCRVRRFRLLSKTWPRRLLVQLLKYAECFTRMVLAGYRLRPVAVHANDLNALPIGWVMAVISGAKLLYDSHELWAEGRAIATLPHWLRSWVVAAERLLAARADVVVTTTGCYAQHMSKQLEIPEPIVIRNLPPRFSPAPIGPPGPASLRKNLGIPADAPVLLYIGGVAAMRGLETMMDALCHLPAPVCAVALGPGTKEYVDSLAARARSRGVSDRFHVHPALPFPLFLECASEATLGISAIEDCCLSYRYTLPNKIFEYLQAGLPIIASDLPEMRAIVEQYGVGEVVTPGDPTALASSVRRLLAEPRLLDDYRRQARVAAEVLHWENEETRLVRAYRTMLKVNPERDSG